MLVGGIRKDELEEGSPCTCRSCWAELVLKVRKEESDSDVSKRGQQVSNRKSTLVGTHEL